MGDPKFTCSDKNVFVYPLSFFSWIFDTYIIFFFHLSNALIAVNLQLCSVSYAQFCETDAWLWRRGRGNSRQCPRKDYI